MDNLTAKLYQFQKTVVTTKDLAILWQETNHNNLKSKIAYYVKRGVLTRLTRGVFAKEKIFDPKELAGSLYTPSYISFETVLREAGIIFQHYDTIFVAGPWTKTITVDTHTMTFRKLKDPVLYNPSGVTHTGRYSIATPERAFLDMIYLFPTYYFDHLESLNWDTCLGLVPIYNNQQLKKRLETYRDDALKK